MPWPQFHRDRRVEQPTISVLNFPDSDCTMPAASDSSPANLSRLILSLAGSTGSFTAKAMSSSRAQTGTLGGSSEEYSRAA